MKLLFKNANIVDINTGIVDCKDILTDGGKIVEIGKINDNEAKMIDLDGNFVLPNFVNVFCNSIKAYENNYGEVIGTDKKLLNEAKNLIASKNILAGAIFNDVSEFCGDSPSFTLENVDQLSENDLNGLGSKFCANKNATIFMKIGQSLQELGTIDKEYGKPLSRVVEDFGFLDRKAVIVGGNCFEKDDLEVFSQYDCDFCLAVGEDGKLGRRPTNLISLLNRGIRVALASGYNSEIDFFGYMRQLLMTQRAMFEDVNVLSEQDVLKIAICNGAEILGITHKIEEGKLANFMVVENTKTLYNDIFSALVWEKSKRDVLMTVYKGEILQKNGEIFMKKMP